MSRWQILETGSESYRMHDGRCQGRAAVVLNARPWERVWSFQPPGLFRSAVAPADITVLCGRRAEPVTVGAILDGLNNQAGCHGPPTNAVLNRQVKIELCLARTYTTSH